LKFLGIPTVRSRHKISQPNDFWFNVNGIFPKDQLRIIFVVFTESKIKLDRFGLKVEFSISDIFSVLFFLHFSSDFVARPFYGTSK